MSRRLCPKKSGRFVAMKQELYRVLKELGIGFSEWNCIGLNGRYTVDVLRAEYFSEAIMYVSQVKKQDISKINMRDIYRRLAKVELLPEIEVEKKLREWLKYAPRELSVKYGEVKAPELRQKYFGDEYADIADPEIFIIGLARYLKSVVHM